MMTRFFGFLFLGFLFSATSCSTDKSESSSQPYASVSLYNVSPDAPYLNISLNGNNVAASVPFGSFTLYNQVAPGMALLKAQTTSGNVSVDTSFSITEKQYYSLFLTDAFTRIKAVIIKDSLGSSDSGYAGLRFFVFSPGISNVDLYAVKDSTYNNAVWKNRSFSDNITLDSINRFVELPAGTYSFYAIKTNSHDTLARFTGKSFADSSNYTLMLEGFYNLPAGDTTLQLGIRLH